VSVLAAGHAVAGTRHVPAPDLEMLGESIRYAMRARA
jgi:hypothetical protein